MSMSVNVRKKNRGKQNNSDENTLPTDWESEDHESEDYTSYNPPKYPGRGKLTQNILENFTINTQDKRDCGKSGCSNLNSSNTSSCTKCDNTIKETESFLKCEGRCKKSFHIKCAEITITQFKKIKQLKNIVFWLCENCKKLIDKPLTTYVPNESDSTTIQSEDITENIRQIQKEIKKLRTEINKPIKMSYSSAIKGTLETSETPKNIQSIIIKPKKNQSIEETNKIIKMKINPRTVKAPITKYLTTKKGFVIIDSESNEKTQHLYELTKKELGSEYDIQITKQRKPRVIIMGLNRNYETNEDLLEELKDLNQNINEEDYLDIKFIRQSKFSKKWIAYAETSGKTFKKIVNRELNIEWGQCKIVEDFNILRCLRCCSFGHKTKDCRNSKLVCAYCTGDHVKYKCDKQERRCVNCFYSKEKNETTNTNHSSDDLNCPIYAKKIEISKRRTNYEDI